MQKKPVSKKDEDERECADAAVVCVCSEARQQCQNSEIGKSQIDATPVNWDRLKDSNRLG